MPRSARKLSKSGIYHIIIRGIGQQNIFEDDGDRIRFIETLKRYKTELGFEMNAYCLMRNHVHILLKDDKQQLDLIMKKIAGSYAVYFNWKYDRVGHLFQDRFKSEPVEDHSYFLTVLRYIHRNPQKAMIADMKEYDWSSYQDYIDETGLTDVKLALELLGGRKAFELFMTANEENQCLDITDKKQLSDKKAIDITRKISKVKNIQQIQSFDREQRDSVLRQLKGAGLSIRQIERITGVNRGVVQKA
ncbi:MAG: transposase [Ruminiclostridium sp.]|jgi:REP element-mobilizing transposase RayT|nr:transposase [Thermoclostridium sp.]NLO41294.1 transposase [Ruminiclostridium sp.]